MLKLTKLWNDGIIDEIKIKHDIFNILTELYDADKINGYGTSFSIVYNGEAYEVTARWSYSPLYCKIRKVSDDTVQIFRDPTVRIEDLVLFILDSVKKALFTEQQTIFFGKEED